MNKGAIGRLQKQIERLRGSYLAKKGMVETFFSTIHTFDIFQKSLYYFRHSKNPRDQAKRQQSEDVALGVSREILNIRKTKEDPFSMSATYRRYQALWYKHFALFFWTLVLFVATMITAYFIVLNKPEYAQVLVGPAMMEQVINQNAWFETLQKNPLLGAFQIGMNNIKVCLNTFALSSLLAIGGLYILSFNALMIGSLFAFCALYDFNDELYTFVVAHGPLELSVVVASAFSGFIMGLEFYKRPIRNFKRRFGKAAREGFFLLLMILPWLIVAAAVEGFVSPYKYLGHEQKLALGCVLAIAFWSSNFLPLFGNPKESK